MTSKPFRPRRVHVVSHTHWDREWYLTFQEFRVNLTHVVKKVLDALENDPDFHHFLLDGQAIVLEDHLQVCPEDEDRIQALVASGALNIGPWYMLPDEFLVSGESLVRNLLVGWRICERFGGAQPVGYMADSFGHPAQIPQILREGGLDSFVYTRGNGSELEETGHEYLWQAPDGSTVTAIQQCGGYCAGAGLGHEEIWHAHTRRAVQIPLAIEKIRKWFDEIGRLSNGDVVLMNNGCDHFPPQRELGRVLNALREEFPEVEFVHSTLERYLDDVREGGFATKSFSGELCQGRYFHILSGVWSARMYLKQRNDVVQRRLADVEAVAAYTHFAHNRYYPAGTLVHCWKELLKNHPHDSICGCSTDEVHRDMIPRFDEAQRTAEQVIRREMEHLAPTFAVDAKDDRDTVICVFNPLPYRRTETIRRLVVLQPFGIDPQDLRLLDENGNEVPMRVHDTQYVERFWGVDYRVMLDTDAQCEKLDTYMTEFEGRFVKTPADKDTADCFLLIEFEAELPALSHVNLRLTDRNPVAPADELSDTLRGERSIENELVRVEVADDHSLTVTDKATGRTFTRQLWFEEVGDRGDEYDFSPVGPAVTISRRPARSPTPTGACATTSRATSACLSRCGSRRAAPSSTSTWRSSRASPTAACAPCSRVSRAILSSTRTDTSSSTRAAPTARPTTSSCSRIPRPCRSRTSLSCKTMQGGWRSSCRDCRRWQASTRTGARGSPSRSSARWAGSRGTTSRRAAIRTRGRPCRPPRRSTWATTRVVWPSSPSPATGRTRASAGCPSAGVAHRSSSRASRTTSSAPRGTF
jgi:hypothetical protein